MRHPIPAHEHEHSIEVRRSRFLAALAPADSVDAARAFVQRVRERHPDATHHCWAHVIGPPGATDRVGMSDDGEPHGTAGRPILHALLHGPVGDVVAVVSRWYGGTKLGTGGLRRAYGDAVQQALATLPLAERIRWREIEVDIDYAGVEPLRRLLATHEASVVGEDWGARAVFRLRLPEERMDDFEARVVEMSNGTARCRRDRS